MNTMKKRIYYIAVFFIALLAMPSCDSLDLAPEDYSGSGNFWNNKGQVDGFMNGIHANLRTTYQNLFFMGEARGGTFRTGTSSLGTSLNNETIKNNLLTKDNTGISNWGGFYAHILQVNHFIENVEREVPFLTSDEKNHYLGQAYGIRAFYYFLLYKTYGGVPLETSVKVTGGSFQASELYLARSSAEETLNLIKEDINKSESYFGDNYSVKNKNIWSKYVSLMLKAEIYTWSAKVTTGNHTATGTPDLEIAKSALNPVLKNFSLLNKFEDIFSYTNKNNNEIIFSLYFSKEEYVNWGDFFIYSSSQFIGIALDEDGKSYGDALGLYGSGLLRHEYLESFVKSFDKEDSRRGATFLEYYMKDGKTGKLDFGASVKKMLGHAENGARYYDSNICIYRYSEALLMMAEIENGLGNACASYINQVRQRAYGLNFNQQFTYTEGNYASNELTILKERDKEFVAENKRWFDVVRMRDSQKNSLVFSPSANYPKSNGETAEALLKKGNEDYKLLWPIEINLLNNDPLLEQTPGY